MRLLRRQFVGGAVGLAAASASAQPAGTGARVGLRTGAGLILLVLATEKAPITSANFLRYVDDKRFDGASFYRAMRLSAAPPAGLIQGGLKNDPARALPPIAHESTIKTGLRHIDGVVSMARYDPGTAASEFFICIGAQPSLDADPQGGGDNQGFAAFGLVVAGMDVVRAILASPVSSAGEGVMKGQMLEPPITIITARRAG
ncbi:MAG TPA: peptidylprolyl isomerase [Caulobacteraceae bacterium]